MVLDKKCNDLFFFVFFFNESGLNHRLTLCYIHILVDKPQCTLYASVTAKHTSIFCELNQLK